MNKTTQDFLRPFPAAKIMDIHGLMIHMRACGLDAAEVESACQEFIKKLVSDLPPDATNTRPAPGETKVILASSPGVSFCPECKSFVIIKPVNVSRCTNIGGPWKTSLECTNDRCRFTELSIKTLNEWRYN